MAPEHTDVDEYTCPEPGCEFVMGAAGPVDDDGYDEFDEQVREHQAGHRPARVLKTDDRVYAIHPTPWAGRVGTVVRDGVDSLDRARVLLDGDDNWVAIEAEYLIPSFDVEEVFGEPGTAPAGPSKRAERAVVTGLVALAIFAAGYGLHDAIEPSARECVVAVNTADRLHIALGNLLSTVRVRGDAIGREEYAKADADVNSVLDEVEPLDEAYTAAANECTGGAR